MKARKKELDGIEGRVHYARSPEGTWIVIDGEGNYDPERLRTDVQKIVEAETAMFGGIPYHDYTFILHLRSNTGLFKIVVHLEN